MARGDYAQRGNGRNQARSSKGKGRSGGSMPGWIWAMLGLSFGLAIAALVYITRPSQPMPGQTMMAKADAKAAAVAADDADDAKAPGKSGAASSKKDVIKLPPKEKARFTFYDILPGQEVVVPSNVTAAAGKTLPGDDGLYVIQVAAYRTQEDADAQKAKLALIGVESRVEKITIDNKDTYFRVRVGPANSLSKAHTLMARLEQNGVQAVLIKLK
jgi:cell division protein FtsN